MLMNRIEKANKIRKICVYCGSGPGTDPAFVESARAFGAILAKNDIGLVYGGGGDGMMGALAHATLDHGGMVTGIIPEFLTRREHALREAQQLIVTHDMHERKRKMFEMADAFVAMPGGIGTLEEIVEQITWVQLGRHRKPILLANIGRFWDPLRALIEHMKKLEFIRRDLSFELLVADKVADILPMLQKAAAAVPEEAKEMPAAIAERL
ncbi:MAG TPA: TIGR00730 family Rossman fold protein [Pseudolabrys sp.]